MWTEDDGRRPLRAAWWDWPFELVTEHARTFLAGAPNELEAIAATHRLAR